MGTAAGQWVDPKGTLEVEVTTVVVELRCQRTGYDDKTQESQLAPVTSWDPQPFLLEWVSTPARSPRTRGSHAASTRGGCNTPSRPAQRSLRLTRLCPQDLRGACPETLLAIATL